MTRETYTDNSWLFRDSTPITGLWYWDSRGFPKLSIGTENFPFPWDPLIPSVPVITINTQPQTSTIVTVGNISSSLSVSAGVTLGATLNYQWYFNTTDSNSGGTLIASATNSNFTIPTTLTTGTYYYYCVVSAVGAVPVTSNVATVTVTGTSTPVITIVTEPQVNTSFTVGSISGSLSVSAGVTQGATLNYQWYSNTITINSGGTAISGATNSSFTIPTTLSTGTYYYYCVVSAVGAVSVSSNVAIVRVMEEETGGISCNAIGFGYLAIILCVILPFVRKNRGWFSD
jgi:plastocyanin